MNTHRSLIAWQRCCDLTVLVYRVAQELPDDEKFGLSSQMRRAAVSACANIAEGYARSTVKDLRRFLRMAISSLAELDALFYLAGRLGMAGPSSIEELELLTAEASTITFGLYRSPRVRR
jgi:four helix bundle protein